MHAMKKSIRNLKFKIIPLLFSCNCTYWTMSSLFSQPVILTFAAVILLNCFIFVWFEKIKGEGKESNTQFIVGTILYMLIVFAVMLLSDKVYGGNYVDWFKSTQPGSKFFIGYWVVTLMLLDYFFASTVYYFSEIIFRLPVLFLLSIVPLLLQTVNTKKEISTSFILFLILLFSLYVERTKNREGSSYLNSGYRWYMGAVTLFVAITLITASIMPKPSKLPRIKYVNAVLSYILTPVSNNAKNKLLGGNGAGELLSSVKLKKSSSINSVQVPAGDRIIFEIDAKEPLYFRVQTWDKYSSNRWYVGNMELENGYTIESQSRRQTKLETMMPLLDKLRSKGIVDFSALKMDSIFKVPSIPQMKSTAYVKSIDYPMQTYINTPGVVSIKDEKNGLVYMDKLDSTFFGSQQDLGGDEKYKLVYVSQKLDPNSREFQYVRLMNKERYNVIEDSILKQPALSAAPKDKSDTLLTAGEKAVLRTAKVEMEEAAVNFLSLPDNLPKRIYSLANNLTENITSDYDKAYAIESFFHSGEFKYDLGANNSPDDMDSNDYFIFQSKRGGCVQFASAMVILARAAGLPARYVEGFVAQDKDENTGKYIIREKDAHAFPEIYISGFGWMVFEPTASAEVQSGKASVYLAGKAKGVGSLASSIVTLLKDLPMSFKVTFIPLVLILAVVVVKLIAVMRQQFWKRRIIKHKDKNALQDVFIGIEALLSKINLAKEAGETPLVYSRRIKNELGISMDGVTEVYNKVQYGDVEPSEQDIKTIVTKYEEIRLFVKKLKGRIKGWII